MDTAIYTKPLQKLEKAVPSNAFPVDITPVSMAWRVHGNYGQIKRLPFLQADSPNLRPTAYPGHPSLQKNIRYWLLRRGLC